MSQLPRVSIVMPAFNEERYIEACLASVQAQDYPSERVEILVADGRSTDRTREILARLTESDPRIQLIDNPARLQAAGLGLAVKAATGDRLPHVAAIQFGDAAMAEIAEQQRTRGDGFVLDIDAAKRSGAQRTQGREHDAAAGADLKDARVANAVGIGAQHLDEGRGIFARTQRRVRGVSQGRHRVGHLDFSARRQ